MAAERRCSAPTDRETMCRSSRTGARSRRPGRLTGRSLEGREVNAVWISRQGIQRVEGKVKRNEAGELIIESWVEGVTRHIAVPREACLEVLRIGRKAVGDLGRRRSPSGSGTFRSVVVFSPPVPESKHLKYEELATPGTSVQYTSHHPVADSVKMSLFTFVTKRDTMCMDAV